MLLIIHMCLLIRLVSIFKDQMICKYLSCLRVSYKVALQLERTRHKVWV